MTGAFVISLDFELFWGVRDSQSLADYGPNVLGVRQAIPALLEVFREYDVRAIFAIVGMIFFRDRGGAGKKYAEPAGEVRRPALRLVSGLFQRQGW